MIQSFLTITDTFHTEVVMCLLSFRQMWFFLYLFQHSSLKHTRYITLLTGLHNKTITGAEGEKKITFTFVDFDSFYCSAEGREVTIWERLWPGGRRHRCGSSRAAEQHLEWVLSLLLTQLIRSFKLAQTQVSSTKASSCVHREMPQWVASLREDGQLLQSVPEERELLAGRGHLSEGQRLPGHVCDQRGAAVHTEDRGGLWRQSVWAQRPVQVSNRTRDSRPEK